MNPVNVHEAKTRLSALLARVEKGEEIIIARAGVPVAKLVPIREPEGDRTPGRDAGLLEVPEDLDAPLPEDVLVEFEA
jgi:prevent-host-death family protein